MGRQLVAMRMGMGIVPRGERWFYLRVMGCMGRGMVHGMMPFTPGIACFVLAGL